MSRKHYLVTGGTGFIGSALVRALVQAEHRVRVLDDDSRGRAGRLADLAGRIEFVGGDVRDPLAVQHAARGVDGICHLAFVNGTEFFYQKPDLVLEVGVKGMINVLDALAAEGVPELLLMSSSEVYQTPSQVPTDESAPFSIPDPLNPRYSYAGGKLISELLAINYGRTRIPRVTIVRPHNVYGPDMGFEHVIPQLSLRLEALTAEHGTDRAIPFPIQGTGEETRAFVYIDDFVDGTLKVLERGEHLGIYHVGTQREEPIRRLAELVAASIGARIQIQPGPAAVGGTPRRCPDIAKIKALGYEPRVTLEEGLRRTVPWYMEHGRKARLQSPTQSS
jgi:dTDP-glucose 4,6-dehydratase/UDP-glucose 4-epimerase